MTALRCRVAPIAHRLLAAPGSGEHSRSCLRCQAEEARERAVRRALASLADEVVPAPPYLAAAVMARLGGSRRAGGLAGSHHPAWARYAAAGVGAAAAAAVFAGVIRRRSRTA